MVVVLAVQSSTHSGNGSREDPLLNPSGGAAAAETTSSRNRAETRSVRAAIAQEWRAHQTTTTAEATLTTYNNEGDGCGISAGRLGGLQEARGEQHDEERLRCRGTLDGGACQRRIDRINN
eukprot:688229-Pyramimonas_sp.AAC.2